MISGESLTEHLPPLPLFKRVAGPRDGFVNCDSCSSWPAPRRVEERGRLCEECYRKRLAEDSS